MRPKVVYDTNIVVSAVLKPESALGLLVRLAKQGEVKLFVSPEILKEYERVLRKPELGFRSQKVGVFLHDIKKAAAMVRPAKRFSAAPDEPDNRFLECAERAKAEYLVTGNKKHFPFPVFKGVKILSPAEFLDVLRS
jgi:putative PIN family toxin of toxin-antitoxin system